MEELSLGGADDHNQDGLQVLDAVRRHDPNCVSLLLTGFATVELAVSALTEHGALTCLRKEAFRRRQFREQIGRALASARPPAELPQLEGGPVPAGPADAGEVGPSGAALLQEAAAAGAGDDDLARLTERERQVLDLVARGRKNKEIAEALVITGNTVKRHLKAIFEKLGVHTRSAAAARAASAGLPATRGGESA